MTNNTSPRGHYFRSYVKTAKNPLRLYQLLTYSPLAETDAPKTAETLTRWTGLGVREVELCLSELIGMGLVVKESTTNLYAAVKPPEGWFPSRLSQSDHWGKTIGYFAIFPTPKLRLEEAVVWSFILMRNHTTKLMTATYIGSAVGMSTSEVIDCIRTLSGLGALSTTEHEMRAFYVESLGQQLDKSTAATVVARGVHCAAKSSTVNVRSDVKTFGNIQFDELDAEVFTKVDPNSRYLRDALTNH